MIRKDEYRTSQGSRNIRGWSFFCKGCGFKSYVYKSRDIVEIIQSEHPNLCPVAGSDSGKLTVLKPKAVPKARIPVWE